VISYFSAIKNVNNCSILVPAAEELGSGQTQPITSKRGIMFFSKIPEIKADS
jgi:hypothetical protein